MKRGPACLLLVLSAVGARPVSGGGDPVGPEPRPLPPVDLELPDRLPATGALFEAVDSLSDWLRCSEQEIVPRPGPGVSRCRFPAAELLLRRPGNAPVRLGFLLVVTDRDGEGGYHRDEIAFSPAVVEGRIDRVTNVLRLGRDHHWDSGASLLARRIRVVDLDRDGDDEVCVETLRVTLERCRRERHREVAAFLERAGALEPFPPLDHRCPARGYRALLWAPPGGGVYRWEGATSPERRELLRRGVVHRWRP